MSAAVCGSKRSFFEELPPSPTSSSSSPPLSKRLRCSSTSPTRFSTPSYLDHLRALFPHIEFQLLERALEEFGNDLEAAIKSLNGLCLWAQAEKSAKAEDACGKKEKGEWGNDGGGPVPESFSNHLLSDGANWVDLFVREMMSATSIDDARARAARILEVLGNSISKHASAEATQNLQKENMMLKEQIELVIRENNILKRAVSIQHERQKEFEDKNRELENLRQMISQYQEQMRTLEVNNYALTMHLKQAQQSSTFPGRLNPDVF